MKIVVLRVVALLIIVGSTLVADWQCLAQDSVPVARPTGIVPEARPALSSALPTPKIKVQPLSVTVVLTDNGTKFSGTLSGLDQWPMKTSFGETNVPLSAVAGIKFAEEGHPSTTVVLHNGDSVTGALDLNHVQIETSWGKAEIDSGHINSMLFSPGLVWTTEPGLNGNRWKLVAEKENRPPARLAPGVAANNQPVATPTAPPVATAQPALSAPPFGATPFGQPGQPLPRPPVAVGR